MERKMLRILMRVLRLLGPILLHLGWCHCRKAGRWKLSMTIWTSAENGRCRKRLMLLLLLFIQSLWGKRELRRWSLIVLLAD